MRLRKDCTRRLVPLRRRPAPVLVVAPAAMIDRAEHGQGLESAAHVEQGRVHQHSHLHGSQFEGSPVAEDRQDRQLHATPGKTRLARGHGGRVLQEGALGEVRVVPKG